MRDAWLRHGATWFVGVDALPNDEHGAVAGGPPLVSTVLEVAQGVTGVRGLHPGQLSVTFPGYPGRDPGESDGSYRYRRDRAAAHLDGLLPVGPGRRRYLREPHAYILGIALDDAPAEAAPLVVWEGSHDVMRATFRSAFAGEPPERWPQIDVTESYQDARRAVFATCARRALPLRRGEAVLLHRLCLHGVAPWQAAPGSAARRAMVYFRPVLPRMADWLDLP